MYRIQLSKYGEVFSGRSHAKEILEECFCEGTQSVYIDFSDVRGAAQGFISEMFVTLYREKKISFLDNIKFSATDKRIESKVSKEKERLSRIFKSKNI